MARKRNRGLDSKDFDSIQETRAGLSKAALFLASARVEAVPPGWFRSEEIAAAAGLSIGSIGRHITALRKMGAIDERKFTVTVGSRILPVAHYMLSKDAARAYNLPPYDGKRKDR